MDDRTVLEINDEIQATDRVRRWRAGGGWILSLILVCGHNPQRLLTDQRSEEEKFRDRFLSGIASMFGRPYRPWRSDELPWMRGIYDSYEDDKVSLAIRRASTYRKD